MNRLAWLCLALAACGGSESGSDPTPDAAPVTPGDDPGTGTGTLLVDGSVTAEPSVPNAADPTNFSSNFSVRVARAGVDVTTGAVRVTSVIGSVDLLFDTVTMRWRGAQAGYFEAYTIDVQSGTDTITGARVDGPDIHTITAPTLGATVSSVTPLAVTWTRAEEADTVTVQTREINPISTVDTGTYSLPMGTLRSKPDQTENEQVEIVRSSLIAPAGAVAGSTWRVRIRNGVNVLVQRTQ